MKTIKVGAGDAELSLGGETVLFRHEKTFVSRTRYAMSLCTCMDDETVAQKLEDIKKLIMNVSASVCSLRWYM